MLIPMIIYGTVGGLLGVVFVFIRSRLGSKSAVTISQGAAYGAMIGAFIYIAAGRHDSPAMNQSTENVKKITEEEYGVEVAKAELPVVMDFYAAWCGPCKSLAPILDDLAGEFKNQIKFVKVNVDDSPDLARRFEVSSIPTLVFLKNGKVKNTFVGLTSAEALRSHMRDLAAQKVSLNNASGSVH